MNKILFALSIMLTIGCFVGCKTAETEKEETIKKHNLTHIDTKDRYMLSSALPEKETLHVAVINILLPKGNQSTVQAELTFGSVSPRKNGKAYVQATSKTIRLQSMLQLVDEISVRTMHPPVGIFMLVDGVALGMEGSPDADEDVMMFTRELDSLLADKEIQQVYLIPNSFSISYK